MVSGNPANPSFHVSNRSEDGFVSILVKSISSPTYMSINMSISIILICLLITN